jgi:hypothetical protein
MCGQEVTGPSTCGLARRRRVLLARAASVVAYNACVVHSVYADARAERCKWVHCSDGGQESSLRKVQMPCHTFFCT